MRFDRPETTLAETSVAEAVSRGIVKVANGRVTYVLNQQKSYDWNDPEEWIRTRLIAWLVVERDYPSNRIRTEVTVPRRIPSDFADVVVYSDDNCRTPYLVVETKSDGQARAARRQAIEQAFGNANSLRARLALYDEGSISALFNVADFPSTERETNKLGPREALPRQYDQVPLFLYIAGGPQDIQPAPANVLETRIRRAHSVIWAGGRRDPMTAFDEWSKLLFAKVADERSTPSQSPRRFQVGTNETTAAVANRIHGLFGQACREDPTIFQQDARIVLPDNKIAEVVRTLQSVSFVHTDIDNIGKAFEEFFGSIFRGELGQYFTMRQLARFSVAMLDITHEDFVIDPTAGSGGFLLEALLQVWHFIDRRFVGQSVENVQRLKIDFALHHVYGIEVHDLLSRICKINLLLHHDGHTNIEGGRSCLDAVFSNPRLNPPKERFTRVVGNPPFGDEVVEGDDDHLGTNRLENFEVAAGRSQVASEQAILERSIDLLEPGGRLGLVVPDGLLNNQGAPSNCPTTRRFLAKRGRIEAIISLPDHAFRKAGAQNKTSILFFRKFSRSEQAAFDRVVARLLDEGESIADAVTRAVAAPDLDCWVFLAEANHVGYTPTGAHSGLNDLNRAASNGGLNDDQIGTILGEWKAFRENPNGYPGRTIPDCMALRMSELWSAHSSNRLDPKYHLFRREMARPSPAGWVRSPIHLLMRRREEELASPDSDRLYQVMTISQTGEIRPREAGKGNNPPEWRGTYFEESPGTWFAARAGDVVFSSIDLWKGCIAVVPEEFDGALVTKEFPIYEILDQRLTPAFLQCLLRSRYYQRAFRAITTGHSNRRRTQVSDFEMLEISFPPDPLEQSRMIKRIIFAQGHQRQARQGFKDAMNELSNLIDGRGDEDLPEVSSDEIRPENGIDIQQTLVPESS